MSFLTERYFQMLDRHKIYNYIYSSVQLKYFMERHVICVWGYHEIMKSLHKDIISRSQPLNTEPFKEVLKIISELVLGEQLVDGGQGRITSHLELYMEMMESLHCDMEAIFAFFDLLEKGVPSQLAIHSASFQPEVLKMGIFLIESLTKNLHERATVLFYEGEPFIPDEFLTKISKISGVLGTGPLTDYWERHIEGLKNPGFSAIGRLVEILCMSDPKLSQQAEAIAEQALLTRLEFWNAIAVGLEAISPKSSFLSQQKRHVHLSLVR